MNSQERILRVLDGKVPDRAVFSPNIWQWFEYQKLHDLLPQELKSCATQLEVLELLGVDIFSRNLKTDIRRDFYGGHTRTLYHQVQVEESEQDNLRTVVYHTPEGDLREVWYFDRQGCTLVQKEFLFKDFVTEYGAFRSLLEDREYVFDYDSYRRLADRVGDRGLVMAGEFHCPLKLLHFTARVDNAIYLLFDHEREMMEVMEIYAEKTLDLIRQIVSRGVKVVCSMDNLDSFFYTPDQFGRYCASFYSRAAEICHRAGALLFSHACGRQREIIDQVVACGIDGLEGIAFPPLGDIELWEARQAGERFIVEGGLSAIQLEGKVTRKMAEDYVQALFERMRPFDRFIFSMSCNTSILTAWDTLRRFRDAWLKYGGNG